MIAIGSFAILRPLWLLALPFVVGLLYLTKSRGGTLGGWERAADPHLLKAMVARGTATIGKRRAPAVLLTLLFGTLALSGPAIHRSGQDRLRNLDATIIVMDTSADMVGGQTIRDAASAAHDVLEHAGARQTGLIVYAGDAYVASALTDFTGAIDADLFVLDDQTVPDVGVRPDLALALAKRMLDEAHVIKGDLILISGGGGLDAAAVRQAAALASAGHRVYAMDAAGPATAGLAGHRRAGLEAVAAAGGGFSVAMLHPQRLLAALANQAIDRTGDSMITAFAWRDLGRFLLLLAALPLLFEFRRARAA